MSNFWRPLKAYSIQIQSQKSHTHFYDRKIPLQVPVLSAQ